MSKKQVPYGCACKHCMGMVKISLEFDQDAPCPMCAGSGPLYKLAQEYSINWNDQKSQYDVSFTLPRSVGATGREPETLLKMMAARSRCKCGGRLTQRNHALSVTGDQLKVSAAFVCKSCSSGGSTFFSRAKYGVAKALGQVKKIKVGKDGFELERTDSKKD